MEDEYTFTTLTKEETEKPPVEASLSGIIEISTALAELKQASPLDVIERHELFDVE